jgi:hypothetical protein
LITDKEDTILFANQSSSFAERAALVAEDLYGIRAVTDSLNEGRLY